MATVPAGTAGDLQDGFYYVPVAPFELSPGWYSIVMSSPDCGPDWQAIFAANVTTAWPIEYDKSASGGGSFPNPPTYGGAYPGGMFGPNFQFTSAVAEVPEPSSALLLAASPGLIYAHRGRR